MTDLKSATLGQVAVRAHDIDRAVAFYRDRLGLPFLFQFPGLGFFQCGATRLMLGGAEQPEHDHVSSVLYFKVTGLEGVYGTLRDRGVEFIDAPHLVHRAPTYHLWMAFFKDSEGNTFAIMEEKPV